MLSFKLVFHCASKLDFLYFNSTFCVCSVYHRVFICRYPKEATEEPIQGSGDEYLSPLSMPREKTELPSLC